MTTGDREDRELRRLFEELHADDRPPSFRRLWSRAREGRGRHAPRRLGWAAAALAAGAAAVVAIVGLPGPRPAGPANGEAALALARDLSRWEAPMDFLLRAPGDELYRLGPPVDSLPLPDPPEGSFEMEIWR